MNQLPDVVSHPSSPPSEGGADSYKHEGTPDTRLTAFSPPDDSTKSSRLDVVRKDTGNDGAQALPTVHHVTSFNSLASAIHDKDPFITSTPEKTQTKLSATASAFRPLTATPVVANGSANTLDNPKLPRFPIPSSDRCPILDTQIYTGLSLSPKFSFELKLGRMLTISSPDGRIPEESIRKFLEEVQKSDGPFLRYPDLFFGDTCCIRATNIRDVPKILTNSEAKPQNWTIETMSVSRSEKESGNDLVADENEGLHNIFILSTDAATRLSDSRMQELIRQRFQYIDIFALVKQPTSSVPGTSQWVIEFADSDFWTIALSQYNQGWTQVHDLVWILVAPYTPGKMFMHILSTEGYRVPELPAAAVSELAAQMGNMSLRGAQKSAERSVLSSTGLNSSAPTSQLSNDFWGFSPQASQFTPPPYQNTMTQGGHSVIPGAGLPMMSPISPTISLMGSFSPLSASGMTNSSTFSSPSQAFQRPDARRHNALRVNRGQFSPPGPHHNHVNINKIREGTDVRTTIMLRNIPNKVDQSMLKRIIDESSWGKYDFMYLRIDFANDCNVSYAFINFVDPLDIIDFVNARGNQRWNCFKSDKVAEISYATIQGKDCLVQKFRNSSVMLEASHYRPKLYYTSNGPNPELSGREEPFPEPDNQSKMKRSCENAEHVGLFTPNAGQHFRDEQRRRRSQYDRGTRLAALEECNDFGMYPSQENIR